MCMYFPLILAWVASADLFHWWIIMVSYICWSFSKLGLSPNRALEKTSFSCSLLSNHAVLWGIILILTKIKFFHSTTQETKWLHVYRTFRRRQWHPTPAPLPGKSHGRRCLVGCSPRGRKESHTTEWLHFHFSLSCTGEGNGNPLQCYCLENPRDGGAWWAAIYGVAQSWTRLKRLSNSSSSIQDI